MAGALVIIIYVTLRNFIHNIRQHDQLRKLGQEIIRLQ